MHKLKNSDYYTQLFYIILHHSRLNIIFHHLSGNLGFSQIPQMSYPGKYVYLRIPIKLQLNQRHFERFLQVFSTRLTIDQTQLWKRRALHTIRRNATMVNHQDNAWSQIWASLWLMRKWKLITKLSSTWLLILAEMETQQVSKESVPSPWWLFCDWWKAC